jgi:hypothetical protein
MMEYRDLLRLGRLMTCNLLWCSSPSFLLKLVLCYYIASSTHEGFLFGSTGKRGSVYYCKLNHGAIIMHYYML